MSNAFNKYSKLQKLGAFKASLRLLQDPNASKARKAAIVGATLVGAVYTIFPEPTDAFPLLGLVDEGLVLLVIRSVLGRLSKQYRQIPTPKDSGQS